LNSTLALWTIWEHLLNFAPGVCFAKHAMGSPYLRSPFVGYPCGSQYQPGVMSSAPGM